jgi:hypothetical protein
MSVLSLFLILRLQRLDLFLEQGDPLSHDVIAPLLLVHEDRQQQTQKYGSENADKKYEIAHQHEP